MLAHVERYDRKDQFARYQYLLFDQVLIQSNTQHFLKGFGSRKALRQLADGLIHFIGSDCHNTELRPPNMGEVIAVIRKKLGEEVLQYLDDTMHTYLFGEGA